MRFIVTEKRVSWTPRLVEKAMAAAMLAVLAAASMIFTGGTPLVVLALPFSAILASVSVATVWSAWSDRHREHVDASGIRIAAYGSQKAGLIGREDIAAVYLRQLPNKLQVEFCLKDGRNVALRHSALPRKSPEARGFMTELIDQISEEMGVKQLPPSDIPYTKSVVEM